MTTIDPSKTYRTRDGCPVRIYATDGAGDYPIHGAIWMEAWVPAFWTKEGRNVSNAMFPAQEALDLVEVTLADELRDLIPWEALRPEIRWVAMDDTGYWKGFDREPYPYHPVGYDGEAMWMQDGGRIYSLEVVQMPDVPRDRWAETLIQRPGV